MIYSIRERIPKRETHSARSLVALRADDGPGPKKLGGYAAKFNLESESIFDPWFGDTEFVEVIAPGAFARTLRERPDVRALFNHDTSNVLGRGKNGTLKLWEDDTGLGFECVLPDTVAGRDAHTLVSGGYIDGCSFGFTCLKDSVESSSERVVRTLIDVELYEVSIAVAFPAYEGTETEARHRDRVRQAFTPKHRSPRGMARFRARMSGLI